MSDPSRLVMMANQIARNLAVRGEEAAIAETARHLRDFWDPRMKTAILKVDRSALDPIVASALDQI